MTTHVTMYLYENLLPRNDLELYRCIKCSRPLFKASSRTIVLANTGGMDASALEPSAHYIEHQCHSCKTVYKILFQ